jgi:prepilin-type N-terminal cleavage/methylation domain-containing protein
MKNKGFNIIELMIVIAIIAILLVVFIPLFKGTTSTSSKSAQTVEAEKAEEASKNISFTDNAERDNIVKRLKLTSDPGLTGFILLMNEAGQPIMYTGVIGKITSSGKRLTKPYGVGKGWDCGANWCDQILPAAPSDEGTWGDASEYIYFWTAAGQYIQWNGKYLYSDKPFRTSIEPLVISISSE